MPAEKKEAAKQKRRDEAASAAEKRAAEAERERAAERQRRIEETPEEMKHFKTSITYKVSTRHGTATDRARRQGSTSSVTKPGSIL